MHLGTANWEQAIRHGESLKLNLVSSNRKPDKQIPQEQIPLCANVKELHTIGPGFPLYFIFLKYSIFMVFQLVISYSCLTLYWSYVYNHAFCLKGQPFQNPDGNLIYCTSWMILFSRLEITVDVEQKILRITSFLIHLMFLVYIREQLRKYHSHFHEVKQPTVANYSILIKNIPKQSQIKAKVHKLFSLAYKDRFKIEVIYPVSHLSSQFIDVASIEQLQRQKLQLPDDKLQNISQLQQKIEKYSKLFQEQMRSHSQLIDKDEAICEKVFVTLNSQ